MIGTVYCNPAMPSGISSVIAASGPYAALVRASSPKIGMPAATPICSARSSLVARGRPKRTSVNDMVDFHTTSSSGHISDEIRLRHRLSTGTRGYSPPQSAGSPSSAAATSATAPSGYAAHSPTSASPPSPAAAPQSSAPGYSSPTQGHTPSAD